MTVDWSPLQTELAIWRAQNLALPIWWRDDDAIEQSAALDELLSMGEDLGVPLHLAVIPKPADKDLSNLLEMHTDTTVLVHGWTHTNRAPDGAKKAEFGHPRADAAQQAGEGLQRLQSMFGARVLPMFVPPWNRIDPSVTGCLADVGYNAVSTYTPRAACCVAGVVQINCHVDPIHWKGGGGLAPADETIAQLVTTLQHRRAGLADVYEPLGVLTHHLVHDAAIWGFTRALLSELLDGGATPLNLLDLKDNLP